MAFSVRALPTGTARRRAVENITFDRRRIRIVGESDSGESVTANTIMGLLPRSIRASAGTIQLGGSDGTAVVGASPAKPQSPRGRVYP